MRYFLSYLIAIIVFVSEARAQENTYSMIIKLKSGAVLTIGPNEVDSILFNNDMITISGTNISEMFNQIEQNTLSANQCQADIDTIKRSLLVHDSLFNEYSSPNVKYKIDNIIIDNPSRDGFDYCGSRTIVGAGNAPNCVGDRNVIFGTQNLNLTYLADKDRPANRNVAVGYHSQFRAIDGSNNVSIGNETLDNLSHGDYNTAVGSNALRIQGVPYYGYTTEGETINYNTAVGGNSMYFLIGNRNVGIGYNTLCGDFEASGSYNVAIGTEAGAHHIGDSFCFYLDNIPRANNTEEREKGLMFGKFDTIPNNQLLSINAGLIILPYLPGIDPHILGALWNDNGVLRISSGI